MELPVGLHFDNTTNVVVLGIQIRICRRSLVGDHRIMIIFCQPFLGHVGHMGGGQSSAGTCTGSTSRLDYHD